MEKKFRIIIECTCEVDGMKGDRALRETINGILNYARKRPYHKMRPFIVFKHFKATEEDLTIIK